VTIAGLTDPTTGRFSGQQLVDFLKVGIFTSQYVEFFFQPTEKMTALVVSTTNPALEMDNLAVSFSAVTPPAGAVAGANTVAAPLN